MIIEVFEGDSWIKREPSQGEKYRVIVNGQIELVSFWNESLKESPIMVTVSLSKERCTVGELVDYTIDFSEPITVQDVVPISVSDRNGNHVTNIGCTVIDGSASGSFIMEKAGDFTVTNEAINYHRKQINAVLELTEQPWLRVYQ
jgi:hypothetical protein